MMNNLSYYRRLRKMTQTELANYVPTSKNTISSLERGEFSPRLCLAYALSDILQVSVFDLFPTDYYGSPCKVTKFTKHS